MNIPRFIRELQFFKQSVHPKTVHATDTKKIYFNTVNRDLQKYENIYRAGGLVSQAIDAYPLFGLGAGYTLEGEPGAVKTITEWFHKIDIDTLLWQAWVDALVYGDGIQENVYARGGDLIYLVPRNPKNFTIDVDEWGMIQGYTQRAQKKEIILKPEKITNLTLLPVSGESYGVSLLGRAFDDVMRDTKTAESTATAIERHGYPRYHIKVGSETNTYSDEAKKDVASEFTELKADNEFVSDPDIDIIPIDTQGVNRVDSYNEWSMSRLLSAMGVPSEVIGTGQSTTTYATASVEMVSFIKRVEAMQLKVARCYNSLIDLKTGIPGQVKLTFNKIDMAGLANTSQEQTKEEPDK
jgi:hypothetical protein